MIRRDFIKNLSLLAAIPLLGANWIKTKKGVFLASEHEDVYGALQKYCYGRTFLDLGSGDGRVVDWAKACGAKAHGIEYEDFATDIKGDFFEHPILTYGVLFYYLNGCDNEVGLFKILRASYTGYVLVNKANAEANHQDLMLGEPIETIGKVNIFRV